MHARNRTWPLGSDPAERCRQRTMPVEGGDGSTLSLDFTSGVLDPRLTFTRGSNATFINSSGLVQFAAVNEFRNTGWVTSTTPTGWNVTFGTGTTTWNNDGTLTMNTGGSSTRPCINANSFTVSQGIPYTFGYRVVSASGSPQISSVISSTLVGDTFAINGTPVGGTTVVQAGDVVSCTFTPTTTSSIPRMGPGVNFGMTNTAMTITQPQINPGMTLQAYRANSSTTAANNDSARFDYDPTTIGSPRGLLIEGSANNLSLDSENFSAWSTANTSLSSESGDTNPDGITVPTRVSDDSTNAEHNRTRSPSLTTATTYTKSVWFKNPATNGRRYGGLQLFAGGGTDAGGVVAVWDFDTGQSVTSLTFGYGGKPTPSVSCVPYKSGWYRVSISMTVTGTLGTLNHRIVLSNGTATSYANSGTALGLLVWGAQLETGSGASSYIPTGASQGSRSADHCTMPTSSFITGTLYPHTLFVDCIPATPSSAFPDIVRIFDRTAGGTFAHGTEIYYYNAANMIVQRKISASTNTERSLASGLAYNTRHKIAVSIDSSAFLGSYDGSTALGVTTAPAALPTVATHLGVGCTGDASPGAVMFGTIRQIKFWPTALSQSAINAITTL